MAKPKEEVDYSYLQISLFETIEEADERIRRYELNPPVIQKQKNRKKEKFTIPLKPCSWILPRNLSEKQSE